METGKPSSLLELCIKSVIDNRRHLADVGDVEFSLLEQILPHCSKEQLIYIEKSTKGRDLSPVTNKLWKRFFEMDFGKRAIDDVIQRMKQKKATFKWSALYKVKLKRMEEDESDAGDKLKRLYEKERARKQSRKVQVCNKVPESRKRMRNFGGAETKMSKLRKQFLNSLEARNIQAVKMKKATAGSSHEKAN